MKVKVLGCSGGIGAGLRTTSLLIDGEVLIDAGTGVGDLPLQVLLMQGKFLEPLSDVGAKSGRGEGQTSHLVPGR